MTELAQLGRFSEKYSLKSEPAFHVRGGVSKNRRAVHLIFVMFYFYFLLDMPFKHGNYPTLYTVR